MNLPVIASMRILVEGDCENCGGQGTVYDPRWGKFNEKFRNVVWNHIERLRADRYWSELGFDGGEKCWPPEEACCDSCEGTGRVRHTISLGELAEALSDLTKVKERSGR